ncbi:MAG TPA: aldehyde dehydrogenase family protein [Verrucomicrobiae bacterium]
MTAPHIPALRRGRAYESLDHHNITDCRSGQVLATLSQVNAGIIRKDLPRMTEGREALRRIPAARLVEICAKAGAEFLEGALPLGGNAMQTPREYLESLSASSGLPHVMVRRNMAKIHAALTNMPAILAGLTRGLDLSILDKGHDGRLCFYPAARSLGLVMPSNSPAVNSLWLPAIALKIPVVIKPGREEPWTPFRLIQAFIAAGAPPEAFGFYPADHEGAGEILRGCGRALVFGDKSTTSAYAGNPAIQVHGPGYSKILVGEDQIERWPEFIDVMAASISDNGGRSCINASAIVVPKYADEIAEALARKLGPIAPLPADDGDARLAGFANTKMADFIDSTIEEGLKTPGARDAAAPFRGGPRKVNFQGGIYLRPTIVRCDSLAHPLANREFLCPYASVVEAPQSAMLEQIGPSLAVTAITRDEEFITRLVESPLIDRLNIGPVSTMAVSWDQPHEGNMFEFLYRRRALEFAK